MSAINGGPEVGMGAAAPPPELVPGMRWRRVFPGEERQLRILRRWLASLLGESSARDDLATVATELASNTIRHTASGRGGWFAVEIAWHDPVMRVTVADSGASTEPQVIEDPTAEHGRGLLLVRGLSLRTGVCGDQRGRLVWADVRWDGAVPAVAAAGDPYEAAIRDGEAALAHRFNGVPAWFGRSTLRWWALLESGGLVSAPSARELGTLLYRLLHPERPEQSPTAGQCYQRESEEDGVLRDQEPDDPTQRSEPGARPHGRGEGRTGGRGSRGNSWETPRSGRSRPALVPASLVSGAA